MTKEVSQVKKEAGVENKHQQEARLLTYSPDTFVARENEIETILEKILKALDLINKGLTNLHADRSIAILGDKGIGKSWLLEHLFRLINKDLNTGNIETAFISFDKKAKKIETEKGKLFVNDSEGDLEKIILQIKSFLSEEFGVNMPPNPSEAELNAHIQKFIEENSRKMFIIMLDAIDSADKEVLGGLEKNFIEKLSKLGNVFFILASRTNCLSKLTSDNLRNETTTIITLENLSPENTYGQIAKIKASALNKKVFEKSLGHPLTTALYALGNNKEETIKRLLDDLPTEQIDKFLKLLEFLVLCPEIKDQQIFLAATHLEKEKTWYLSRAREEMGDPLVKARLLALQDGSYKIDENLRNQILQELREIRPNDITEIKQILIAHFEELAEENPKLKDHYELLINQVKEI